MTDMNLENNNSNKKPDIKTHTESKSSSNSLIYNIIINYIFLLF